MDKTCRQCGETKIISHFHKKGNGFDSRCKQCISVAKAKNYRYKNSTKRIPKIINEPKIDYKIVGTLSKIAIDDFSALFATNIKEMINEGKL